jgi:Family of unknown function (DUF5686)/CarboxypepD_reg-like domain
MRLPLTVFFIGMYCSAFAGGIRGIVKGDDGSTLPFASIYVKQTGSGAATDANGRYEVSLAPGQYDVYFQFLGFETVSKNITVGDGFQEINVTLKTQIVQLNAVTIRASKEDPAYSVMRKAISKAKYHTQQVDSFSAKVYIKGKGKMKDFPWVAKKLMEKEGITKDRLFIQESVSEIQYKRPNIFKEKVIAIYTQGKNNDASPNEYIFGSLYEPEIAETISPLSPKSFSYYKFEYLGSFKDRDIEINKIKVIPRSKGDNVFSGIINIVEDVWSIHSVDLKSTKMGVGFDIKQIYNPVEDVKKLGQAWMPVSQTFLVSGSVFGFEFEGQYLATVKDYKLFLNPALKHEIKVLDEKKVEKPAVVKAATKTQKADVIQQKLADGKEVTNKELNQLIKQYEKEEQKKQPEPEVLSDRSFKVDSTAKKKDSVFWAEMRPAALDPEEVRGYRKADSMAVIEKKREEGDTLKKNKSKKGFQPWDLLTGDTYKLGKTTDFEIHFPYGGFNTVEGFNFVYRMSLYKRWVKRDSLKPELRPKVSRFEITPVFRYSVERNNVIGFLRTDWRNAKSRVTLETGRYVTQYNSANPIHHFVNTLTTLMWGNNLMKIYERDFADLTFRHRAGDRFTLYTTWSYNQRRELFNNTSYTLFKSNKDSYTLNAPVNNEVLSTNFDTHQAFTGMARMEFRPFIKYRIRNGNKYRIDGSSPLFAVEYRKGFKGIGGSDVDYDLLDLGVRYGVKLGIRGRLDANVHAGAFLNNKSLYFMDYKHFQGNRTPIITSDPDGSYRLLDYYSNSTSDKYLSGIFHYHFRKLLVSRIPKLRLMGVQENMFVSYLGTPASGHYTELGYSIDGILRIFRVEGAASFVNGKYTGYGVRLGIASNITANFGD